MPKWDWEDRQRDVVLAVAGILAVVIVAVLGFGYWRENVARGSEVVATAYGSSTTLNDLVPWTKPRVTSLQQTIAFFRAQGQTDQIGQLEFQVFQIPDEIVDQRVTASVVKHEADRRGLSVTDAEVDQRVRERIAEFGAQNAPLPTATPTAEGAAAESEQTAVDGTPGAAGTVGPGQTAGPAAAEATIGVETPPSGATSATNPSETEQADDATASGTSIPESTPTPAPTPTPVSTLTDDSFKVQYNAFLERTGYTDEQYRQLTREELLEERLKEAMSSEVPASQEQVHARQIVVPDAAKAQEILDKLQQGQSFEELAKAESTDALSKDAGGDLGWLPRDIQGQEWDAAAFSLQPGQRSGVVALSGRSAIIEVLEREPSRPLTEEHLTQLRDDAYQKWLTAAKTAPDITTPPLTEEQRDFVLRRSGATTAA